MDIGKWNILRIDRIKEIGAYLTDGREDVLLPIKQVPRDAEIGDSLRVFVYRDSKDRPIATTREPLITVGEIKRLKCKSVGNIGAFMDSGLERDVLLPFKEQTTPVKQEKSYLVAMYVDKTGRLAVTMKISDKLRPNDKYKKGDMVKGTVYQVKKDFGAFVAIDDEMTGLIHESEIFDSIYVGDVVDCRVVKVREDGKTDLAMRQEIPVQMIEDAEMVFDIIKSYGGKLPFNDKASAELIKKEFGLSKNAFKRAVGHLYKEKKIEINDTGIVLNDK
ncbi:MAG: S1 RNA-binding domain-containing protein [Eubacterium sp.]|nr:S1 RNA-binding domain-containing protein [Eubacterium sp.]